MSIPIENQNPGQRVDYGDRTLELFAQIGTSAGHVWLVRDPDSGVVALATPDDLDSDRYAVYDPDKPQKDAPVATDGSQDAGVPAEVHANASPTVEDPANTQATDTPDLPAAQESPQTPFGSGFGGMQ